MKVVCLITGMFAFGCVVASECLASPFLVVNEDNDHYFKLSSDLMNEAALKAYVDDIARGHVTHFVMCLAGQRTSFDSKAWDPIWNGIAERDHRDRTNNVWCVNAKKLFDAGIDPYRVWIARCREKGVSPWLSIRMNDCHFTDRPDYFRHTYFWKAHPEFRRSPEISKTGVQGIDWGSQALDYAHPEVRNYVLGLVREVLERYDMDGLELDWARMPCCLKEGREQADKPLIDGFMAEVRRLADETSVRLGRKVKVGVKVVSTPEANLLYGLDPVGWARNGWVDAVAAGNSSVIVDFDIPVADWKRRLGDKVAFVPSVDLLTRCRKGFRQQITPAEYRGWADGAYAQGADGLYFFNLIYRKPEIREEVYSGGFAPEALRTKMRDYLVTERSDSLPDYGLSTRTLPCRADGAKLGVRIGSVPADGRVEVILGFDRDEPSLTSAQVTLGDAVPFGTPRRLADSSAFGGAQDCRAAVVFPFDVKTVRCGDRVPITVALPGGEARVGWVTVRILPAVRTLSVNVDNDVFFKKRADLMTREGVEDFADGLCGDAVTDVLFCPCGQRASFDSKAWEPIWAGIDEPDLTGQPRNIWPVNAKALFDQGIDPYEIWLKRVRATGRRAWLSMRMNDIHFPFTERYFRQTNFWRDHPEWRTGLGEGEKADSWLATTLDYAVPEVRKYSMTMVRELIDRYEADGLEFDWVRFVRHFRIGEEKRNAHLLTEFLADARAYADLKRGRGYLLAVRVPTRPETAARLGLSVGSWIEKGLVDVVIPCNDHPCTDFETPVAVWRAVAARAGRAVRIWPGTDMYVRCPSYRQAMLVNGLATLAGWADAMTSAQGSEGVYLFNAPYYSPDLQRALYAGEIFTAATRRYPCTHADINPYGTARQVSFPAATDGERGFRIVIGTADAKRRVQVVVGFAEDPSATVGSVMLNDVEATDLARVEDVSAFMSAEVDEKSRIRAAFAWSFPSEALRNGTNIVRTLPFAGAATEIRWLEVNTQEVSK